MSALLRAARAAEDELEAFLGEHGLHPAHYNVLRVLRQAGAEGLGRNAIRDRLYRRMPDVTRLLDRMAEAGLVRRVRDAADRRCVRTRLTVEGRRLVDSLDTPLAGAYRRILGRLGQAELARLTELLTAGLLAPRAPEGAARRRELPGRPRHHR